MLADQVENASLSGYSRLIEYHLQRADQGYAEISLTVGSKHLNRLGVMHGGVMATLIDTATGYAVAFAESPEKMKPAVTLTLNTQFLGQTLEGDRLVAIGRHIGGGKTIAYASAEVRKADGTLVGRGDAVYRFLSERKVGSGGGP
ncbi:MAG TPA: PaaI family thioesterase [Dongiaceae bacterium]|nr:PaaI family thioesterase [Dongiaceae bacterium]